MVKVEVQDTVGTGEAAAWTHHTLSAHTDAVRIFVGAARSVVHQLLHVSNIPSLFGLAIKVASFLGCIRGGLKLFS